MSYQVIVSVIASVSDQVSATTISDQVIATTISDQVIATTIPYQVIVSVTASVSDQVIASVSCHSGSLSRLTLDTYRVAVPVSLIPCMDYPLRRFPALDMNHDVSVQPLLIQHRKFCVAGGVR